MKKVILSLVVLVSLTYSQEILSTSDLLDGILIDVTFKGTPMQLKNGCYKDTTDEEALSYSLNLTSFSANKRSAALTIVELAGGMGNGAMQRIGFATKSNGKTYIRMGGNCASKWANILDFTYTTSISIKIQDETLYDTKTALLIYNIVDNTPVLNKTKSHFIN